MRGCFYARLSLKGSDLYETHKPEPTPRPGGGTWTTLGPNSVPWIVQVSHLVAPGIIGCHVVTKPPSLQGLRDSHRRRIFLQPAPNPAPKVPFRSLKSAYLQR